MHSFYTPKKNLNGDYTKEKETFLGNVNYVCLPLISNWLDSLFTNISYLYICN